jgi:hypothetical protein
MMSSLLSQLWGTGGGFVVAVRKGRRGARQVRVASAADAAKLASELSARGLEAYFSCAGFDEGSERKQSSDPHIRAIWLDLDCGEGEKKYPDKQTALATLSAWGRKAGFPRPSAVIDSGGGLHVYWFLDRAYTHQEWTPVAKRMKATLETAGVKSDLACTADSARILRVPGTNNYKLDAPRPVTQLLFTEVRHNLDDLAKKLTPVQVHQRGAHVPVSASAGLDGAREGGRNETVFKYACSLRARGVNQNEARVLVQRAAAQCEPPLSEIEAEACLKSAWRYDDTAVVTAAPESGDPWPLAQIGPFTINARGVFYSPPAIDGVAPPAVEICGVPVWVESVGENVSVASHLYCVGWRPYHSKPKSDFVDAAKWHADPREVRRFFGKNGIADFVSDTKLMSHYISQLNREMLTRAAAKRYYGTLGWHADGFVLNGQLFGPNGDVSAVPVESAHQAINAHAGDDGRGELSEQKRALSMLASQGPEYQAALLVGMGTPLLGAAGRDGCVLSLAGPAGTGKTLTMDTVLSMFGRAKALRYTGPTTANALGSLCGAAQSVPVGWDDNSGASVEQRAHFLYAVANGQTKGRMGRDGDVRIAPEFKLNAFITSNQSILEFDYSKVNDAQRRRAMELRYDRPFDEKIGREVARINETNYGKLGAAWVQILAAMRDKIAGLVDKAQDEIREWDYKIPNENRHALWACSAALVAGRAMKTLGWIDFDPIEAIQYLIAALELQASEIKTDKQRIADTVRDWLSANAGNVMEWNGKGVPARIPTHPLARVDEDFVYIHSTQITAHLIENQISRDTMRKWLDKVQGTRTMSRLAPTVPAVYCWKISRSIIDEMTEE